jgi:GxxExxY protein
MLGGHGVELDAITREIIGAGMEVHRLLGPGYLESIYRRAMIRELGCRGLPLQTEMVVDIIYKGERIGQHRMDLIVANEVVVELKCVSKLADIHRTQTSLPQSHRNSSRTRPQFRRNQPDLAPHHL